MIQNLKGTLNRWEAIYLKDGSPEETNRRFLTLIGVACACEAAGIIDDKSEYLDSVTSKKFE